MTAKEYLSQAYRINGEIRALQAELEAMRNSLYAKGTRYDSIGGKPADNLLEKAIARVLDREREIDKEMAALIFKKDEIARTIRKVKNARLRELLMRKYLGFEKWEQIAVALDIDTRYVYTLREKALNEIKKILKRAQNNIE